MVTSRHIMSLIHTECQYFGLKKKCTSGSSFYFAFQKCLVFSQHQPVSFLFPGLCLLPRIRPGKALGPGRIVMEKGLPRGGFSTCLDFLHCPAPLTHPASTVRDALCCICTQVEIEGQCCISKIALQTTCSRISQGDSIGRYLGLTPTESSSLGMGRCP